MESTAKMIRIRSFNKSNLLNWIISFEKNGLVMCAFKNCNFMAFDIEAMSDHYSYCSGEIRYVKFNCDHCSGGTDTKDNLLRHKILQHSDKVTMDDFNEFMDKEDLMFPSSKGDQARISRVMWRSWEVFLECKKYIKCLMPTCQYITSSIEDMQIHYQHLCTPGLRKGLIHMCHACGGRTNNLDDLVEHIYQSHSERKEKNSVTPEIVNYWSTNLQKYKWAKCIRSDCNFIDCDLVTLRSHYELCSNTSRSGLVVCNKCSGWLNSFQRCKVHSKTAHSSRNQCKQYKYVYMRPVRLKGSSVVPVNEVDNSTDTSKVSDSNHLDPPSKNTDDSDKSSPSIEDIIQERYKRYFYTETSSNNLSKKLAEEKIAKLIPSRKSCESTSETVSKSTGQTKMVCMGTDIYQPFPSSAESLKMNGLTAGKRLFHHRLFEDDDDLTEASVDDPSPTDSNIDEQRYNLPHYTEEIRPITAPRQNTSISPSKVSNIDGGKRNENSSVTLSEDDVWKPDPPSVIKENRNYKEKRKRTNGPDESADTVLGRIAKKVVKDDTHLVPVSIEIDRADKAWVVNVPTSSIDSESLDNLLKDETEKRKKALKDKQEKISSFKKTFWKNIQTDLLNLLEISVKNSSIRNSVNVDPMKKTPSKEESCSYSLFEWNERIDGFLNSSSDVEDSSDNSSVDFPSTLSVPKKQPPRVRLTKKTFTQKSKITNNNIDNNSIESDLKMVQENNETSKSIDHPEDWKSGSSNARDNNESNVGMRLRKKKRLNYSQITKNKNKKMNSAKKILYKKQSENLNYSFTSDSHNNVSNLKSESSGANSSVETTSLLNLNTLDSNNQNLTELTLKKSITKKSGNEHLKSFSGFKKEFNSDVITEKENSGIIVPISNNKDSILKKNVIVKLRSSISKLNVDISEISKSQVSANNDNSNYKNSYNFCINNNSTECNSPRKNSLLKNEKKQRIKSVIYTDGEHSNTDDDASDSSPPTTKLYPDSCSDDNDDSICIRTIVPITSSNDFSGYKNQFNKCITNNGSSSNLTDNSSDSKDNITGSKKKDPVRKNLNDTFKNHSVSGDQSAKGKDQDVKENLIVHEENVSDKLRPDATIDIKMKADEISNDSAYLSKSSELIIPNPVSSESSRNDADTGGNKTGRRGRKKAKPKKIVNTGEDPPSFGSLWGVHFQMNSDSLPEVAKEIPSEIPADKTDNSETPIKVKKRPGRKKKQPVPVSLEPVISGDAIPGSEESSVSSSRPRRKRSRPISLYEEMILPDADFSNVSNEEGLPVPSQLIEMPREKRKRTPRSNRATDLLNSLGDRICPGSFLNNPNKIVKCALCQETMSAHVYQNKHQQVHNFMCWLEHEKPLPLEDQGTMMLVINRGVRMHRQHILRCDKCKQAVKSASGFLSHMRFCGKSQEEASQLMSQCELCERLYKPQCLEQHMKTAHGPMSKDNIQLPPVNNIVRPKSSSHIRHPALLFQSTSGTTGVANISVDALAQQEESPDPPSISFNKVRAVPRKLKNSWKEAMTCGSPIFCPIANCDFRCESVEQIQMHYISCNPAIKNQISTCKLCNYTCHSKETYRLHMKNEHCIIANPIENTAYYPVKALKDMEDEVYCTFSSVRYTTFFKPCLQLTKQLRAKILCPVNGVVHPDLRVVWENWESTQDDPRSDYIPIYHSSPAVQFSSSNDWIRLPVYGTLPGKGESLMWTGGRVRSLGWCPTPPGKLSLQYLAVACQLDFSANFTTGVIYKQPATIQLWNYGLLLNCGASEVSEDSEKIPQLSYIMCMDNGPIWDIEWCPSGCHDHSRLGLLACATASGTINIYAMPHPSQINLPEYSCPQFKGVASLKLVLKKNESHQCQSISWSKVKPHKTVVGGFVNGLVAVWDLCLSSTFLREGSVLYPYRIFQGHFSEVTSVNMCPVDNDYVLTGSLDKTIKLWDIKDTSYPVHCITRGCITDMEWLTHWIGFASGMDAGCLPTPSSVFFASLRDFSFQPAPLIGHSTASAMSVSGCDWMNCLVTGYEDGNIILTVCLRQFGDGSEAKKKVLKFVVKTEVLDLEEAESNQQKVARDSSSYEETINMFGIKIILSKMIEDKKMESIEEPRHDIFPIQAINKVCFNPNEQSFLAVAVGYESGFVSVPHLAVPKHLICSIQGMAPSLSTKDTSPTNHS